MSNVVNLSGAAVHPPGEPREALVSLLEGLLKDAKSGKLQSLIATGFSSDGLRYGIWADSHDNVYEMMGALVWLQQEYADRHRNASDR